MDRQRRLAAAVSFLRGFNGKNVVRGYARWFGVDLDCALLELRLLGVPIDPTYADRLRATLREKMRIGRERSERQHELPAQSENLIDFEYGAIAESEADAQAQTDHDSVSEDQADPPF